MVEEVRFNSVWHEGGAIDRRSESEFRLSTWAREQARLGIPWTWARNATSCTTLDALDANGTFGNRTVDVLKIDAEGVDARVVRGAVELLRRDRISVIAWETPNLFPIEFPSDFGGTIASLTQLAHALDAHARMTCYLPSMPTKIVSSRTPWLSLTACSEASFTALKSRCLKKKIDVSNAVCVHRRNAPELHRAFERMAAGVVEQPLPGNFTACRWRAARERIYPSPTSP